MFKGLKLYSGNANFKLAKNIFVPLLWAEILHYLYGPILTNLGKKWPICNSAVKWQCRNFLHSNFFICFLRDNKKNAKNFKTLALLVAILPYAQWFKTTVQDVVAQSVFWIVKTCGLTPLVQDCRRRRNIWILTSNESHCLELQMHVFNNFW